MLPEGFARLGERCLHGDDLRGIGERSDGFVRERLQLGRLHPGIFRRTGRRP